MGRGFWAIGSVFGTLCAAVAFIAASVFPLDVARYEEFEMLTPELQPGGVAAFTITYRKMRECGGDVMIVLHPVPGNSLGGTIIGQGLLGNRPAGKWTIKREVKIPFDIRPGKYLLQEILSYDCGIVGQVVRSPPMPIDIIMRTP